MTKTKKLFRTTLILTMITSVSGLLSGIPALAKSKVITLEQGDNYQLKIKKDSKIKYNKNKTAKLSKKGKIKALKEGKCIVKVTYKNKHIKYIIKVNNKNQDPSATPAPHPSYRNRLVGGRYVAGYGYIIKKIVPKDAETSYVYMTRNPKVDNTGIVVDNQPLKYVVLEIKTEELLPYYDGFGNYHAGYKEGDWVTYHVSIDCYYNYTIVDNYVLYKGIISLHDENYYRANFE